MPPSAISKRPLRALIAPVKAPFSWPNSSLSSNSAGMAPQLIATNGLSRRGGMFVDGAGNHLLAGARLPQHQYGGIKRRDLTDQPVDPHHRLGFADEAHAARLTTEETRVDVAHGFGQLFVAQRETQRGNTLGEW